MPIARHIPDEDSFCFLPVTESSTIAAGSVYRVRAGLGAPACLLCLERLEGHPTYAFRFRAAGGATVWIKPEEVARWLANGLEVGVPLPACAPSRPAPRLRLSALARGCSLTSREALPSL